MLTAFRTPASRRWNQVTLLDTAGNELATTTTDENGNYYFGGSAGRDLYRRSGAAPAGCHKPTMRTTA